MCARHERAEGSHLPWRKDSRFPRDGGAVAIPAPRRSCGRRRRGGAVWHRSSRARAAADILVAHDARLICQYDAFAGYCAEAEEHGIEHYPLYAWTKAVIADPAKQAKYVKSFSIYVGGAGVYAKDKADALEAALTPLVGAGVVMRLAKHDTDPANSPQMPEKYRSRS